MPLGTARVKFLAPAVPHATPDVRFGEPRVMFVDLGVSEGGRSGPALDWPCARRRRDRGLCAHHVSARPTFPPRTGSSSRVPQSKDFEGVLAGSIVKLTAIPWQECAPQPWHALAPSGNAQCGHQRDRGEHAFERDGEEIRRERPIRAPPFVRRLGLACGTNRHASDAEDLGPPAFSLHDPWRTLDSRGPSIPLIIGSTASARA